MLNKIPYSDKYLTMWTGHFGWAKKGIIILKPVKNHPYSCSLWSEYELWYWIWPLINWRILVFKIVPTTTTISYQFYILQKISLNSHKWFNILTNFLEETRQLPIYIFTWTFITIQWPEILAILSNNRGIESSSYFYFQPNLAIQGQSLKKILYWCEVDDST